MGALLIGGQTIHFILLEIAESRKRVDQNIRKLLRSAIF